MKDLKENLQSLKNRNDFSGKDWRAAKRASRLTMKGEIKKDPLLNKPYNRQDMLNRAANLYRNRLTVQDQFNEADENYTPATPRMNYSTWKNTNPNSDVSRKDWRTVRRYIASKNPGATWRNLQDSTWAYFREQKLQPTNPTSTTLDIGVSKPTFNLDASTLSKMGTYVAKPQDVGKTIPMQGPLREPTVIGGGTSNSTYPQVKPGDLTHTDEFVNGWKAGLPTYITGTTNRGNVTYGGPIQQSKEPVQQPKERKQPVWSGAIAPANWFQKGGKLK